MTLIEIHALIWCEHSSFTWGLLFSDLASPSALTRAITTVLWLNRGDRVLASFKFAAWSLEVTLSERAFSGSKKRRIQLQRPPTVQSL